MSRMKELESKLSAQQRKAAFMLVENEMASLDDKLTQDELAKEIGCARSTLFEWRKKDRNFIAYKNEIADDFLADKRDHVYAQLLKLIGGSQPSVKALDLYLRRFGLLTEKQQVETVDSRSQRSDDAIKKQLDDLDDLLDDK